MKVSETLRFIAKTIPHTEDRLRYSWGEWEGRDGSIFICDNLDGFDNDHGDPEAEYGRVAKNFLFELGMPCGLRSFNYVPDGVERQQARVEWLLFAADIAEEWELS